MLVPASVFTWEKMEEQAVLYVALSLGLEMSFPLFIYNLF
jgi:hypothetical protein